MDPLLRPTTPASGPDFLASATNFVCWAKMVAGETPFVLTGLQTYARRALYSGDY